jgi:hypothetical protein
MEAPNVPLRVYVDVHMVPDDADQLMHIRIVCGPHGRVVDHIVLWYNARAHNHHSLYEIRDHGPVL